MKKLRTSFTITATLLFVAALPLTASVATREECAKVRTASGPVERHPEIHAAIHALEKAKHHLEEANHDFGGHRKEALEACEQAIRQLRLALEADRK